MKSNLNILAVIAIAAATSFAAPAFAESGAGGGHGGGGPVGNGYHGFCTGECSPVRTDRVAESDPKLYAKK